MNKSGITTSKANRHIGTVELAYLLPGLALTWPMVNFANSNRSLFLTDTLVAFLVYALIGSIALGAVVWLCFRKATHRVATRYSFILAVAIVVFCSWEATIGPRDLLKAALGIWGAGLAYIVITLVMIAFAWSLGARPYIMRLGATFLAVAIAIPGVSLALHLASRGNDLPDLVGQFTVHRTRFKPNVYVFVADGYPRQDVLARYFAFDNEPFLRELFTIGYRVRRDSVANYPTTYQSLATLVEMDFVSTPEMPPYRHRSQFQRAITGQSAMVRRFRSLGYGFAQATRGVPGAGCRGIEDLCLDSGGPIWNGALTSGFLRLTPLRSVTTLLGLTAPVETLRDMRKRLELLPRNRPLITFIHTFPPHDPVFDSSCNLLVPGENDNRAVTDPGERAARMVTVRCVNTMILEMAHWLDKRDPGAIVIFLSDHGTPLTVDFKRPMSEWGTAQIAERFPNLLAVRMPPMCASLSGAARSLVNVMEVVFACIEEREPKLRQDRVFVGVYENNPEYGHVREVTNLVGAAQ